MARMKQGGGGRFGGGLPDSSGAKKLSPEERKKKVTALTHELSVLSTAIMQWGTLSNNGEISELCAKYRCVLISLRRTPAGPRLLRFDKPVV